MLEIALNFEQMAVWFNPIVLIGPGLVCVVVGLFIWLGGLGFFRRVLVAVVGAVVGGICGFFITGRNIMSAIVLAGLACAIAMIFEKIFITILAASLAAVFGFAVLAKPYIKEAGEVIPHHTQLVLDEIQNQVGPLSISRTAEIIKTCIADFSTQIKQVCLQMPAHSWAIIAVVVIIFVVAGFFLWRLTSALCCAALGTLLTFAGMILLLLYKGAAPVSSIYSRTTFYAAVFAAMTAFGTIEQLLLCRWVGEKLIRKKEVNKAKEELSRESPHWRTT